jgi:hypothetical protein
MLLGIRRNKYREGFYNDCIYESYSKQNLVEYTRKMAFLIISYLPNVSSSWQGLRHNPFLSYSFRLDSPLSNPVTSNLTSHDVRRCICVYTQGTWGGVMVKALRY